MTKYIVKPHTWFDEGTEALFIKLFKDHNMILHNSDFICQHCGKENHKLKFGIFEGVRKGVIDTEVCCFNDFYIKETNND